jgi:phosphoglycolate phosphatase-like HAD superfamily hydrolase
MSQEYIVYEEGAGSSYVRSDRVEDLREVDVVVFDCDGVLLDIRESYSKTVARVTGIIVEALTGCTLPEDFFDGKLNYSYKRTGGFNNDWSLTYALVMRILAEMPERQLKELDCVARKSLGYDSPSERFGFLKRGMVASSISMDQLYEKLLGFAEGLGSDGVEGVDARLLGKVGLKVKEALYVPFRVGEGIIPTLFEETFSGTSLFQRNHGIPAEFTENERGLVEEERVVVMNSTLKRFSELLGGNRMGIASGSLVGTARHALGELIDLFSDEAQVWHDTVEEAQKARGSADLHKPNPYSLIRASEPFRPFKRALYVGDSMADRLMVANSGEPPYLFAGVYGCVHESDRARYDFLERGSDIVAPTVNDLPDILERIGVEVR